MAEATAPEGVPPEPAAEEEAAEVQRSRTYYLHTRGHPLKGEAGDSFEYVSPEQEKLYSSAIEAIATARGTYKVAVQTGTEGVFGGTDAEVFITLHDAAGNSSKEYALNGELQEGEGPKADSKLPTTGPAARISSQGVVEGRWWDDKDDHFEEGFIDYFFLETGLAEAELGPISEITIRVDHGGRKFADWNLKWVGVSFLAIGADAANKATRPHAQYSFPNKDKTFFQVGDDTKAAIKIPRDEDPEDPSRPLTEFDVASMQAFDKMTEHMQTGDQLFFLAPSWTAPWTTTVTGQPYSHAGTIVVDRSADVPVFLAYEATDNHSGTPDFCMGHAHRGMDHLGMWAWEVARRLLTHHGNVMYSPLYAPEGKTAEDVWEEAASMESSNYAPGDLVNRDIVTSGTVNGAEYPLYVKRHLVGMGFYFKGLRKEGLHYITDKAVALDMPINADDFAFPPALERNPTMEMAMMQFSKHAHMLSASYDKWQFATAGKLEATTEALCPSAARPER